MMKDDWVIVPLGNVIRQRKEFVLIDDSEVYKRCRVQLHAKGVVLRDIVPGAQIKTKEQQICYSGEFLVAEIDAKVGGFGIVPQELEGAIVSSHYFLFQLDGSQLDRCFLGYYIRTSAFRDQVMAQGSTNYAAIRPQNIQSYTIPLPPLQEQQRIVARIEQLTTKIEEACHLRQQSVHEMEALLDSAKVAVLGRDHLKEFRVQLGEADVHINRESRDPFRSDPLGVFTYVDISSVGKGPSVVTAGKEIPAKEAPSRARRVIRKDDLIISTVRPNLRAFAKVGAGLDNQICSTGFAVITCGPSLIPDFLLHQFCSPLIVDQCLNRTTGGHYPALNDTNLRQIVITVPPFAEQCRIVVELDALQSHVDALKRLQDETAVELDALLPAILDRAFKGEL